MGISSNSWELLSASEFLQYSCSFLSFPSSYKICDFYIVTKQKENSDVYFTILMAGCKHL